MIRLGRGKWKGHILRPSSKLCRPTSSLLRGAFLDIAGRALVESAIVWDLCAGSGAVGLETLSWGASYCVFVDRNPRSTSFIRSFLRDHNAMDDAAVITGSIREYIKSTDSVPDIVYIDPPYRYSRIYDWAYSIEWNAILSPKGAVFVECGDESMMKEGWNKRKYGDSYLFWKMMKEVQ
ncbi:MAG: RsmD family RNA methyltransferase [Candidatus Aegiribacteria sp.]|nr:RsmD family RNA methyltransferase [Candidatus Aegiribacteria sp.]